jgi:hypothetical protein
MKHWGCTVYLFSRIARLAPGRLRESMNWSVRMTEKVNQISETKFTLWTTIFSPGVGTLAWTALVEELSILESTETKLMADDSYVALVDEGAKFASAAAIDDHIVQAVLADPDAPTEPQAFATVTQAMPAPGANARAVELGIQIAKRVRSITECPTSFGVAVTGPYGAVTWITGCDSVDQLQRAQEATASDGEFAKLVDAEASKAYLPGVVQTVYRKIM